MEHGPAQNLRQTPGRLATKGEKKWLTSPGSVKKSKPKRKRRNKHKSDEKKEKTKQPSVKDYLSKNNSTSDNDTEELKGLCGYFALPVQERIKRLEQGYITDPEVEIRRSTVRKNLNIEFELCNNREAVDAVKYKRVNSATDIHDTQNKCILSVRKGVDPNKERQNKSVAVDSVSSHDSLSASNSTKCDKFERREQSVQDCLNEQNDYELSSSSDNELLIKSTHMNTEIHEVCQNKHFLTSDTCEPHTLENTNGQQDAQTISGTSYVSVEQTSVKEDITSCEHNATTIDEAECTQINFLAHHNIQLHNNGMRTVNAINNTLAPIDTCVVTQSLVSPLMCPAEECSFHAGEVLDQLAPIKEIDIKGLIQRNTTPYTSTVTMAAASTTTTATVSFALPQQLMQQQQQQNSTLSIHSPASATPAMQHTTGIEGMLQQISNQIAEGNKQTAELREEVRGFQDSYHLHL